MQTFISTHTPSNILAYLNIMFMFCLFSEPCPEKDEHLAISCASVKGITSSAEANAFPLCLVGNEGVRTLDIPL